MEVRLHQIQYVWLGLFLNLTVIYGSDDIANYQYNMIENPGLLAEMPNQPAKNFYGGRYNMEVLQEDRIMYRAGNAQNPYGRWFTSEPPASAANVRIDTAVKTHWIDPKTGAYEASSYIDNVYAIKVPKGTTIYTGPVGPQGEVYVGGYNVMQTYIDAPWTFEVVGKTPLQQIGDRRMIRNEEFLQLREAYIEIGKMVQKYGYGQYNGILRILMGQVNCIDSDESDGEKMKYLIESYSKLFASRGGLSDFIIYDADVQLRNQLNEKYNDEVKRVWNIMKDYI